VPESLALGPRVGLSFESRHVFGRLAANLPFLGPKVNGDGQTASFSLISYFGARVGVRMKLFH